MAFKKEAFELVRYVAHNGTGGGQSPSDPLPMIDGNILAGALEVGMVVESADVVVTTPITGVSAVEIGDAGNADGFVGSADIVYASADVYEGRGAYLSTTVTVASASADTYVATKKYYAAAADLKLNVTGPSDGGAFAVILKGYKL